MFRLIFSLVFSLFSASALLAQPANDACSGTINLGTLASPATCVGANTRNFGTLLSSPLTNAAATAETPYRSLTGCLPTVATSTMVSPSADVWYRVTLPATGGGIELTFTSAVVTNPNIAFYSSATGTCADLTGVRCVVGTGGSIAATLIAGLRGGATYFIQVSGANLTTERGAFTLGLRAYRDCQLCAGAGSTIASTPNPTNAFLQSNTTVNFCFTQTKYTSVETNWFHGVEIKDVGAGWDLTSITPTRIPTKKCATATTGTNAWVWRNTITSTQNPTSVFTRGFYFESSAAPGPGTSSTNPGDNYGDGNTASCDSTWVFCWSMKTKACPPGIEDQSLNFSVNTTADGESGGWGSSGCTADPEYNFAATLACCPAPTVSSTNGCLGTSTNGSATATATGTGPFTYVWSNGVSTAQTTVTTSTINALPGTYTVSVTTLAGCLNVATVTISSTCACSPIVSNITSSKSSVCFGVSDGQASVAPTGGVAPYTYRWSNSRTTSTITGLAAGVYSVTMQDAVSCTGLGSITITQLPAITVSITGTPSFCAGKSTVLSSSATFSNYLWSTGATTQSVTITSAGFVQLTVTDSNGCTGSANVSVTAFTNPAVSISGNTSVCLGGTVTFDAGAGYTTYSWSTGVLTQTITANTAGIYQVTVTNSNSCQAVASITLVVNPATVVTITGATTACTGSITTLDAGGPYNSYLWSTGAVTRTINPTTTNTYGVTIVNALGCQSIGSVSFTRTSITAPTITGGGAYCPSIQTITAQPGYSGYVWSNGKTTSSFTVSSTGTHDLTVTDASGCQATAQVTVTFNANPTPTVSGITTICNGSTTTLTTTIFPGYIWSQGSTTRNITATTAGTYTVTVTDVNGCTGIGSTTVTVNPNPIVSVTGINSVCTGTPSTFDAGGFTTFSWSTGAATRTINVTTAGTYSVTVTDVNGCTSVGSRTLTVNSLPSVTITGVTSLCQGQITTLDAGSGFTRYVWSNGATTQTTTSSTAGSIAVTVTNAAGCVNSNTQVITVNPNPLPAVTGTNVICQGKSTTFTTSNFAAYNWSNGANTRAIIINTSGTYTVTVTDVNGCSNTASRTLTVNSLPNVTISNAGPYCPGTTMQLNSGGGTLYLWSGPNNFVGNVSNPVVTNVTAAAGGVYTVTVTDANNCEATNSTTVTILPTPNITVTNTGPYCPGQTISMTASGAVTYSWSGPNSFTSTLASPSISPAASSSSGLYTVTGTDANTCSSTASTTITVNPNPTPTATNGGPYCIGSFVELFSSAATSYIWSGPNSFGSTNRNPTIGSATMATAGAYRLTITDANGCTGTGSTTLTINALPTITASNTGPYCEGSNIQLNALGASTYVWSGPSNFTSLVQNPILLNATLTNRGVYSVSAIDANGCTGTASTTVTINAVPSLSAKVTSITCFGLCNGSVDVTRTSGNAPFVYTWSNSNVLNQEDATGLCPGTYMVTVVDVNGCTDTLDMLIVNDKLPITVTLTGKNVTCHSFCNGAVTSAVGGGTPNYTYRWSGATTATTANIQDLCPGNYDLTVTDNNGCSAASSSLVRITEPDTLRVITSGTNPKCFYSSNGSARAVPIGGSPFFQFAWNTNPIQTTQQASGLFTGTYRVTITDNNGCTATNNIQIVAPDTIKSSVITTPTKCFETLDGTALGTAVGGTSPYSFNWGAGRIARSVGGLPIGANAVTVSDRNSCTIVQNYIVGGPPKIELTSSTIRNVSCHSKADGYISINVQGGTPGYRYKWWNLQSQTVIAGAVHAQLQNIEPGNYIVTVTDVNNCTVVFDRLQPFNIREPEPLSVVISLTQPISCNKGSNGELLAKATGGNTTYNYLWENGATTALSTGLTTGLHTVNVTDNLGCTATANQFIGQPIPLDALVSVKNPKCNGLDGSILIEVDASTSTSTYFEYNVGNGWGTANNIPVTPGSYLVKVHDDNGCEFSTNVSVVEPALFSFNLPASYEVELGTDTFFNAILVNPQGVVTVTWSPSTSLSCADCLQPNTTANTDMIYTISGVDEAGCKAVKTTELKVQENRNVYIPTGFTPNGDNINDAFMVHAGHGVKSIKKMSVHDRWGELIFQATDILPNNPNLGWKGLFKGEVLTPQPFVYQIEVEFVDGKVILYKGVINLVR